MENNSVTKKYFFGWTNLKWFIRNCVAVYSNVDSFFSKKRVESNIAFMTFMSGYIFYFIHKYNIMDVYDLLVWGTPLALIAGYQLNQIQKEKRDENKSI